ncbi:MAG: hypothetical protein ABIN74_00650 [Ferruginibacter sp.]
MNINRHNYEEFFLLYVDKELTAADRKAVNIFVKENPDLRAELLGLQQTVVKPENISLGKKDWLYMEEDITSLQEDLLLYADDELMATDKKSVEFLLATDKAAQSEWSVLQQTKLQPDMDVVFAEKQSLYRKEAVRVVGFTWWRVAAAAILLGFGFWTGVAVYKNNKTATRSKELAKDGTNQPAQIKTTIPGNKTTVATQPDEKLTAENTASTSVQKNSEGKTIENIPGAKKKNDQNIISPKENSVVQNNNKAPDNNLPKSSLQNINSIESNETKVVAVLPENNSKRVSGNNEAVVKTNPKENAININTNIKDPNVAMLQVANNKNSEEDNNRYLNVDGDKDKRTALGGFLRKAKRVLERTTNVKAGDGVKIAGFEIALK